MIGVYGLLMVQHHKQIAQDAADSVCACVQDARINVMRALACVFLFRVAYTHTYIANVSGRYQLAGAATARASTA